MNIISILLALLAIVPNPGKGKAPIASIPELNRKAETVNSHAGQTSRSTLETDFRSTVILTKDELGLDYLEYPRIKILPDGSYILFYQSRDQKTNKDHDGVWCAFSKDGRTWTPGPAVWEKIPVKDPAGEDNTRYYATCDAVLLQNGDILAFAQFRLGENSLKYRKSWGLAMKRSTDLGKTWGEETVLFRDRVWEPLPIQLPSGEIQLYVTHTNHDWELPLTDITLLRSFDNGYTWTTYSPAMRFADGYSKAARKSVDMPAPETPETVHFTSQMPAAVLLNDGKTMLVAHESVHILSKPKKDGSTRHLMLTLGWNDFTWPQGQLSGDQEGPEKIVRNFVGGSAPSLVQFKSGETAFSYTGNWWYMRTGNETGSDIPTAPFFSPMKLFARWGALTIEDDHTVLATSASVHKENNNVKKIRDIVVASLRLNHRIDAAQFTPAVDGDNADWKDVDEAFFLGSESQAQCCFRFAQDKKNLYVCVDCLDNKLEPGDKLDLYFSDGIGAESIEEVHLVAGGNGMVMSSRKNTSMSAKNYPGEGYVAEFSIKKSSIPVTGADGIYFNAVLTKGDVKDSFNFRNLDKVDNWFQVRFGK